MQCLRALHILRGCWQPFQPKSRGLACTCRCHCGSRLRKAGYGNHVLNDHGDDASVLLEQAKGAFHRDSRIATDSAGRSSVSTATACGRASPAWQGRAVWGLNSLHPFCKVSIGLFRKAGRIESQGHRQPPAAPSMRKRDCTVTDNNRPDRHGPEPTRHPYGGQRRLPPETRTHCRKFVSMHSKACLAAFAAGTARVTLDRAVKARSAA